MALLTDEREDATVTAVTPMRGLVIVDRAFARLLREDAGIQSKILAVVAARAAANESARAQAVAARNPDRPPACTRACPGQ